MLLSVIIPTRNEAANISACVAPFFELLDQGAIEVIVIDNHSTDETEVLAAKAGARVVVCGPERSSQRNRGGIIEAVGDYVFFVDADMQVQPETVAEVMEVLAGDSPPDALYIREEIAGTGYWSRVRNFERQFYDGTCIDGLRVIRRDLLTRVGGFEEKLYAGEDWDLDRRLLAETDDVAITRGALLHCEEQVSFWQYLKKKRYYAANFGAYCTKWKYDKVIRKQCGARYRLWTVFMENGKWRRSLSRPDRLIAIWLYKIVVGLVFMVKGKRPADQ